MKEIFISFSSKQTEEAERIYNFLEAQGLSCFISTRDLVPGEEYASQLVNFLDEASVMVLLLSTDSNNSPHVLREVEYAVSHHIPILVYSLEEVTLSRSMEYFLMTHQWITGNGSKDEMLINGVRRILAHRNENRSETESSTATGTENTISPQSKKNKVAKISPRHSLFPLLCVCLLLIVIALLMVLVLRKPAGSNDNGAFASSGNESGALASRVDESAASTNESSLPDIPPMHFLGDTLTFGSYNDAPIEWRVIKINEDGTMILLSKYILSLKTFDAAEGGIYNEYEGKTYWSYENHIIEDEYINLMARGNNDWSRSNIRTWLNSDSEVVSYDDQAPTNAAVGANHYDNEPGFLFGFTEEERQLLQDCEIVSPTNSFSVDQDGNPITAGTIVTTDKVFLLSQEETNWLLDAKISLFTKPSEACLKGTKDLSDYNHASYLYNTDNYLWLLRDSIDGEISEVGAVTTESHEDGVYTNVRAGIGDYGIRPAICVRQQDIPDVHH